MKQDYKEKYPIGSKWECEDGTQSIVLGHKRFLMKLCNIDGDEYVIYNLHYDKMGSLDKWELVKPWVEKESATDEIALFRSKDGSLGVLSSNVVDGYNDVTILARKTITIVEGEGMDDE